MHKNIKKLEWSRAYPCTVRGVVELFASSVVVLRKPFDSDFVFRGVAPLSRQGGQKRGRREDVVRQRGPKLGQKRGRWAPRGRR